MGGHQGWWCLCLALAFTVIGHVQSAAISRDASGTPPIDDVIPTPTDATQVNSEVVEATTNMETAEGSSSEEDFVYDEYDLSSQERQAFVRNIQKGNSPETDKNIASCFWTMPVFGGGGGGGGDDYYSGEEEEYDEYGRKKKKRRMRRKKSKKARSRKKKKKA